MCMIKEQGVTKGCVLHHVSIGSVKIKEWQMINRL